jgi:hypothetical protein
VKLDNLPVFSTKRTGKNKFCKKKHLNISKKHIWPSNYFFPHKCHHID